ncbi:uncharacterized protein LOC110816177 [Carica papaya]|uniref:uncharacterized protein LOC110816177 n=1 Tax=Carica papaya TaxID=3649 RepID=UPI000B8D0CB2|nr:uncharacterized protein LOC110816177 [Carica papaya]
MELEQPRLTEDPSVQDIMNPKSSATHKTATSSVIRKSNESFNDLCGQSESFRTLEMDVPKCLSAEEKLAWLRSQIIGGDIEFDFPFGRRKLSYADHTAYGRCFHYVEDFVINNIFPFYGNTHTCDSYVGQQTTKMVRFASAYIKRCLGGGEHDAILFCGSGTTAAIKRLQEVMGIAVPSIYRETLIKCLADEERWVVFLGPYEHHSNLLSWRQSLAQVIEIDLDENGLIDMEALRLQLESFKDANRPILGSFSACSNVTGIRSDTRKIARLFHQYGGLACFDFAASGPYVEIDMRSGEADGYDAIFLSPHKFLGGPGSPGILLMSKALYQLKSSPPSTCGGGSVNYVNGFSEKDTLYLEDIEERENSGTPQIIQMVRVALAFWVKEYIGYELIEKQENIYIHRALKRLLPNHNIWILGNTSAKRQAILSFMIYSTTNSSSHEEKKHSDNVDDARTKKVVGLYMWEEAGNKRDKPLNGPFVARLLNDLFGIQARGGCACAGPYGHRLFGIDETQAQAFRSAIQKGYSAVKPGWTRVSFPYYMSNEEFEFILAALEFIATYGQRFLPLYHFNLTTGDWTFKHETFQDILGKEKNCEIGWFPLAAAANAFSLEHGRFEEHNIDDKHQQGMISKYASYLENAKQIAGLLPKFPPQRRLQGDIDLNLLPFRV